jgi:hypothetical protein
MNISPVTALFNYMDPDLRFINFHSVCIIILAANLSYKFCLKIK